jgi:copper ion binding protein
MTTTQIKVSGMTCSHCVNSVTEELQEIAGVTEVKVELESGEVTIESAAELNASEISAAIKEAGYEVVGA